MMNAFPIEIDARQLHYRKFAIPGVTPEWIDARVIQPLAIAAGTYYFAVASGYYADFKFKVTPSGTIDYEPKYDAFLQGRGTARLVVAGFEVTFDARYLGMDGGAGVILVATQTNEDWIVKKAIRLVPASSYRVSQGSGVISSFPFKLDLDGRFAYAPDCEVSAGGFLQGRGTAILGFVGYPVLLDGTGAGGQRVRLASVWGLQFAENQVQFANLLPSNAPQAIQVGPAITDASFIVNLDGSLTLYSGTNYQLEQDSFHGLKRVKIQKR